MYSTSTSTGTRQTHYRVDPSSGAAGYQRAALELVAQYDTLAYHDGAQVPEEPQSTWTYRDQVCA